MHYVLYTLNMIFPLSIESIDCHFNRALKVVEETQELLVVNKPSSLPIHPCGSYRSCLTNFWKKIHHISTIMKNLHVFFFPAFVGYTTWSSCKGFNSLIAILRNQETVEARGGCKSATAMCLGSYGSVNSQATATLHTTHRLGAWFEYSASIKTFVLTGILAIWAFRKKPKFSGLDRLTSGLVLLVGSLGMISLTGSRVKILSKSLVVSLMLNDSKSRQKQKKLQEEPEPFALRKDVWSVITSQLCHQSWNIKLPGW